MGSLDCSTPMGLLSAKSPVSEVRINKVSNGYILSGYGVPQMIANTLPEALELARKAIE